MKQNSSFISFTNSEAGVVYDQSGHDKYPLVYYHVINGTGIPHVAYNKSYYIYVYEGRMRINRYDAMHATDLHELEYGCISGQFSICADYEHKAIAIEVHHERAEYIKTKFRAVDTFGGPIEAEGRLKYIDGCTDSLLIPPVKMGDPCLNHLHFPSNIEQTPHTHPTHRIGIVARGEGLCVTPFGNLPLTTGMIFVIKEWDGESYDRGLDGEMYATGTHCFYTDSNSMDVIAFHPDSDFGPTDIDHPMINRTIVDGVSAKQIKNIQTK